MQLNYSMSNTCKTNLAFKFAKDDQTTPKHCHYFSLTYGSERRRGKKDSLFFWMHWISYSAGSKLHFIGFIHLISQSVFNCHCKNNNINRFGSTKSHLPGRKKGGKKSLWRNFFEFVFTHPSIRPANFYTEIPLSGGLPNPRVDMDSFIWLWKHSKIIQPSFSKLALHSDTR